MRRFRFQQDSSRRVLQRLLALGGIVILAALALLFVRLSDKDGRPLGDALRRSLGSKSTYQNRAVIGAQPSSKSARVDPEQRAVSGIIYGMDGEPIPGAEVAAKTFELAGNIMSTAATTRSDERGHFKLPLPEGTYQINASVAGHGPGSVTARSGDTVSVVLPDSGIIDGHVRGEQGEPMRHFVIDVIIAVPGDAPASPPVWSKSFDSPDGAFRIDALPVWDVVIRATADGYAPTFSEQLSLNPKATATLEMTLARGCVLSGTVKDKSGKPLPGVFVDAESRLAQGELTDLSMHAAAQGESEMDGSFKLSNVPKGTVMVRGYDGDNAVTTATVELPDCDKGANVDLVMSGGGSVTGIARRPDGAPIPGARLTLTSRALGFVNKVSDKDGRFLFEDVPAGSVRVELNDQGLSTLSFIKVTEGEVTEQDVTLFAEGAGEIRGRVTASGKPLAGARLMIASSRQPTYDISVYNPVTDEDGNYRVAKLPPGGYLVSVISVPRGKGTQIKADEVMTVDLDVTPKPAPENRN